MSSRIEHIIDELEDYIASCRAVAFSGTKISVDKETINEFIDELRLKTPDEIKKYQKLISNKDAILADAKEQAEMMIRDAKIQTQELINEHEIMQRAIEQANAYIEAARVQAQTIVDNAQEEANGIRMGSIQYTDDMLANLQMIIEHSLESSKAKFDSLISSLQKDLNIVAANRNELKGATEQPVEEDDEDEQAELAATVKEVIEEDKEDDED